MGKYLRLPATLLFFMLILGLGAGDAQVPDDLDEIVIRNLEELIILELILQEEEFQNHLIGAFDYGPCRSFTFVRLVTSGLSRSAGNDLFYGSLDFGDAADPKLQRLTYVYFPALAKKIWVTSRSLPVYPASKIVLGDETAFWFLLHVLEQRPPELTDPLQIGAIVGFKAIHVPGREPTVWLRVTFQGAGGLSYLTISAPVISGEPAEFGDLSFH